jgi:hypothetical protein
MYYKITTEWFSIKERYFRKAKKSIPHEGGIEGIIYNEGRYQNGLGED